MGIGAAHAFVHHLLDAQLRLPAHVHPYPEEDHRHAGILTNGTLILGAHPGVDQDLGHGVLRRGGLLGLIGRTQGLDVVPRVVVGDVLKAVGDALDQVFLADSGHIGNLPFVFGGTLQGGLKDPCHGPFRPMTPARP